MTPAKEKALELVSQMYAYQWRKDTIEYRNAVNCAIIAVDEILNTGIFATKDYWTEVKTELKKLL